MRSVITTTTTTTNPVGEGFGERYSWALIELDKTEENMANNASRKITCI